MRELNVGDVVNRTAVKVGTFPSGSPEWHAARAGRLGGSEVAAIIGLSPWVSRFSLYYAKRDNLIDDLSDNPAVEWGTRLESAIFEKYAAELPAGLHATTGETFRHVDHDWMNANPDGLVWNERGELVKILEIKTSPRGDGYGEAGTSEVPIYYTCQVLWYMMVMNCRSADLAVLISGADYRVYHITWDPESAAFLFEKSQEFMNDLAEGNEPDLEADFATYDMVRKQNPHLDPDAEATVPDSVGERYIQIVSTMADLEKQKFGIDAEILMHAGKARLIYMGDDVIARRQMPGRGTYPYLRQLVTGKAIETNVMEAVRARRKKRETLAGDSVALDITDPDYVFVPTEREDSGVITNPLAEVES